MILALYILLQPFKKCYQTVKRIEHCDAVYCLAYTNKGIKIFSHGETKIGDITTLEEPCTPIFMENEEPEK